MTRKADKRKTITAADEATEALAMPTTPVQRETTNNEGTKAMAMPTAAEMIAKAGMGFVKRPEDKWRDYVKFVELSSVGEIADYDSTLAAGAAAVGRTPVDVALDAQRLSQRRAAAECRANYQELLASPAFVERQARLGDDAGKASADLLRIRKENEERLRAAELAYFQAVEEQSAHRRSAQGELATAVDHLLSTCDPTLEARARQLRLQADNIANSVATNPANSEKFRQEQYARAEAMRAEAAALLERRFDPLEGLGWSAGDPPPADSVGAPDYWTD